MIKLGIIVTDELNENSNIFKSYSIQIGDFNANILDSNNSSLNDIICNSDYDYFMVCKQSQLLYSPITLHNVTNFLEKNKCDVLENYNNRFQNITDEALNYVISKEYLLKTNFLNVVNNNYKFLKILCKFITCNRSYINEPIIYQQEYFYYNNIFLDIVDLNDCLKLINYENIDLNTLNNYINSVIDIRLTWPKYDKYYVNLVKIDTCLASLIVSIGSDKLNLINSEYISGILYDYKCGFNMGERVIKNLLTSDPSQYKFMNEFNIIYNKSKNIYLFFISNDKFVMGALTGYISLLMTNPRYPIYCAITDGRISNDNIKLMESFGLHCLTVPEFKKPPNIINYYNDNENNWLNAYDKLSIFQLYDFNKIVYIDSDMLILNNVDELFELNAFSAVQTYALAPDAPNTFNSGLMVYTPSKKAFEEIVDINENLDTHQDIINDETLLNNIYKDWNKLDVSYNINAFQYKILIKHPEYTPDKLKILHFLGKKPWEYDEDIYDWLDSSEWEYREYIKWVVIYLEIYNYIKLNYGRNV